MFDWQEPSISSGFDYQNANELTHAGITQGTFPLKGIDNLLYGNLNYSRDLQKLGIENAFNAAEAEKARSFSSEEAAKSRAWQEQMSNTSYSRAAADLKSIGINPYAMMSGFSAASTPAGATASGSAARSGNGGAPSASGLGTLIGNAFALASTVLGIGARREIALLNAANAKEVAEIYANNAMQIADLPNTVETFNYNSLGKLTSRSKRKKY